METRRTRTHRVAAALLALSLTLVGCGGGGEGEDGVATTPAMPSPTSDDATVAATGPGADGATPTAGAGDDGADDAGDAGDFPIPVPDGVVLDALVDAGLEMEGQRQLYYADEDFDRIVAFYDDFTSENGEWARTEVEGAVVYQRIDGEALRTITITPDQDAGAQAEGPLTFVFLVAA